MKSVCITGSVQSSLDQFAACFEQAGATRARPAIRDTEISIRSWHQSVLATHPELDSQAMPGRIWEQLAGDIFLANYTLPLWFWAESASVYLLDFWHSFDPETRFLFLYAPPQLALMDAIRQGAHTPETLESVLEDWYQRTRQMLRFHLHHPQCGLLLEARESTDQSNACLERLAHVWQLPLTTTDITATAQPDDPLLYYLACQFLDRYPQALSLHAEVSNSLPGRGIPEEIDIPTALARYLDLNQELQGTTRECQQLLGQLQQTRKKLDTQQQNNHTLQESLNSLTAEKAALQNELEALGRDTRQQKTRYEETESENELLLLQLHQTQEELEQYILRLQTMETHQQQQSARLQHVLEQHPAYWECNDVQIQLLENNASGQRVQWHFSELWLGERLIPELYFQTVHNRGQAGIIIQRTANSQPLLCWPAGWASAEELPCIPVNGPASQGNNALLSALGTTDWNTLQQLIQKLATKLEQPDLEWPDGLETASLHRGLTALAKTLAHWPAVLRYDSIQLRDTLQQAGYQGLEIELHNLQLGDMHWPELCYRFATLDQPGQPFGQNPRLEFPEASRHALQSWFAESSDNRGPRLELRFAQPNAMDARVWNTLAGNDRLLITALLVSLPAQLEALQKTSAMTPSWQSWKNLAVAVKIILAKNTLTTRQIQHE